LAAERKAIHDLDDFEAHFRDFLKAIIYYGIAQADVYNMDETGFRIGCLNGRIVITHASTKAVYLADPEVRDWVTTIETISASGTTIPAMIILAGSILLEKHFDNNLDDNTLIAITSIGYSNNLMGMEYLQHFQRMTHASVTGKYRMLVFDGHGSHISDEFTWYCWQYDIIPFRLPAHSTHLLQPLDVGVFQPLKHWHQVALHESVQYGDVEYSKTDFLAAYQTMRQRTFKSSTILSAWRKVGLFPFNPQVVLDKVKVYEPSQGIQPPQTPPRTLKPFQSTPTTGNRRAHQEYLSVRLFDHMNDLQALTPSYQTALMKYYKAVEPRLLESALLKGREAKRALQEIEKTRRKSGSKKHVQKNGVLYKGRGAAQVELRNWEEEAYQASVSNAKLQRKVVLVEKEYKKWVKALPKKYAQRRQAVIAQNDLYIDCVVDYI